MNELKVLSKGNQKSQTHVMMCHGFGANNRDLLDLAEYLDPAENFAWHFPQAPVRLPGYDGYAWFPRENSALELALSGAYFSRLAELPESGLTIAASEIGAWIEGKGLANQNWIFGGFSQGSMVALQSALQEKLAVRAIIILSGSLINQNLSRQLLKAAAPVSLFQSHGRQDTILPIAGALALKKLLEESGYKPQWHEFNGGHEIPMAILGELKAYLSGFNEDH